MTVGDGANWDETNPTNSTLATSIDDYDRDLRVGVRSRMALEHEWPASQSSTAQGGSHKFVTLQNQSAKPTVSGTQLAALYTKTVGSGLQELYWENEAGTEVQLTSRGIPIGGSGTPIQTVVKVLDTAFSTAAQIPFDTSIPQISEGAAVAAMSTSITCLFATSDVLVEVPINLSSDTAVNQSMVGALFVGTTANAIGAVPIFSAIASNVGHGTIFGIINSAGTSQLDFSVRIGGSSGTDLVTIGRFLGSANNPYIKITEIKR